MVRAVPVDGVTVEFPPEMLTSVTISPSSVEDIAGRETADTLTV
jgi:hypothetical protein